MSSPQTYYSFPTAHPYYSAAIKPSYRVASYRPLSPPESRAGTTVSSSSNMYSTPSYSAYAGSSASAAASDYGASSSTPSSAGIDLMDLLNDKLSHAYDPLPLDQSLVTQAKTSGALNAKHRELQALQQQARDRLASSRVNFNEGLKAAREVRSDLEWTGKRVAQLKTKAAKKHPKHYARAESSYAMPVDC